MDRQELDKLLSAFARTLSPNQDERSFISEIYASIQDVLGEHNCFLIGSYPRFTSIRPLHDIDVLFVIGTWDGEPEDANSALEDLQASLNKEFINPTGHSTSIELQTHSVTILFSEEGEEIFAVDIVPAYKHSKNEFGLDKYYVPEIIKIKTRKARSEFYERLQKSNEAMNWIPSDPRGYIKVASELDVATKGAFRKTAKLLKLWNRNLGEEDEKLKLKSFHVEQIATLEFQVNPNSSIVEELYAFFIGLPKRLAEHQIPDRANHDQFIDEYVSEFTAAQKEKIISARDGFLVKLERLTNSADIPQLLEISFFERAPSEQFLFDLNIMTFLDPGAFFDIDGEVRRLDGFSSGWLKQTPALQKGLTRGPSKRHIDFRVTRNNTGAQMTYWKVRNSNDCPEPRGEITLGQTANAPEATAYVGTHYVEAYAVRNGVCIAKSKVSVKVI